MTKKSSNSQPTTAVTPRDETAIYITMYQNLTLSAPFKELLSIRNMLQPKSSDLSYAQSLKENIAFGVALRDVGETLQFLHNASVESNIDDGQEQNVAIVTQDLKKKLPEKMACLYKEANALYNASFKDKPPSPFDAQYDYHCAKAEYQSRFLDGAKPKARTLM